MAPTFLACLVILCFEKQRHKQKYCCSPKFKHFAPPLNFGLATPLVITDPTVVSMCACIKTNPFGLFSKNLTGETKKTKQAFGNSMRKCKI